MSKSESESAAEDRASPRRRQRRKDARPAEIVAAAMRLWAERGYAATRLDDVAAQAGIAKGTVYLYFPSKAALFEAALRERLDTTFGEAMGLAAPAGPPTAALLTQFFDTLRQRMIEAGAGVLLKVLIGEGHRFPELVALHRELAVERGGELSAEALTLDPRLVMAPALVAALWSILYPDAVPADDPAALLRQHLALLLRALRPDGTAMRDPRAATDCAG
ncbi:MAG: TetR/AcrR family transcriptional regulator [Xanthomonadales bacterium]|nr:TetR/AcrR family transcriptional regulator [Xanthomonadales bacterium]